MRCIPRKPEVGANAFALPSGTVVITDNWCAWRP